MTDLQTLVEQWAEKAGASVIGGWIDAGDYMNLERFAKLAMAHAAEEAAKVVESLVDPEWPSDDVSMQALACAHAIRERFKAL